MERGNEFWNDQVRKVRNIQGKWEQDVVVEEPSEKYRGYKGEMDGGYEKVAGHQLLLAGPMIDGYLKQIGMAFYKKLKSPNYTGTIKIPFSMFIPWQVFDKMVGLFIVYGCDYIYNYPKTKKSKGRKRRRSPAKEKKPNSILIYIKTNSSCDQIFAPARFDGTYYLSRQVYHNDPNPLDGKRKLILGGKAVVAVSNSLPISMEYIMKTNTLSVTFTVQRYNSKGIAVDDSVQGILDSDVIESQ